MGEVRAKKALGQHFLVDLNIARKICDSLSGGSAVGGPCTVLEVGCGMGVLTQFLLRRSDIVIWGAEIDPESVAYLHAHYPEFAPRLVAGDFLGMNLRERFPEGLKIIGNFPYNISSQIFFKVLENRDLVPECVGMIQKEVAVRLAEPPGSKEYGILSVLLQAWYDIEYLFTVNDGFQPASEGQERRHPPAPQRHGASRLRRNPVREGGESLLRPAAQDDPQLAEVRVRRFRRGRAPLLHPARRAAGRRRVRGTDELGFAIFDFIGHLCTCIRAARMGRISILPIRAALRLSTNLFL